MWKEKLWMPVWYGIRIKIKGLCRKDTILFHAILLKSRIIEKHNNRDIGQIAENKLVH